MHKKSQEVMSYLIFGVLTTIVNFLVYVGFQKATPLSLFSCNMIAWIVSVIFAYITNKLFVFQSKSWEISVLMKEVTLFLGARILSGIFEIGGFPILFGIGMNQPLFGIEGFLAKAVISIGVIVLNYIFSKLLIFKKAK